MLPARACRSADSSPSPGTPGLTGRDGDGSLGQAGAPSEIDPSWRRPPGSKDFDGGIDSYVSSPGGDGGGDGSDALPAFDARRLNRRFADSTSAEVTPGLTGRTGEGWASDEAEACETSGKWDDEKEKSVPLDLTESNLMMHRTGSKRTGAALEDEAEERAAHERGLESDRE